MWFLRTHSPRSSPLAVLVLLAGMATGCDQALDSKASTGPTVDMDFTVRTAPVAFGDGTRELTLPGVTRARERTVKAFLGDGRISERMVERGDPVKAGQPLVRLHDPLLEPAVTAARARLREVEADITRREHELARVHALNVGAHAAQDDLDRVRAARDAGLARRDSLRAELEQARARLEESTLRAPFAGVVREIMIEEGDFAAAGQPIVTLQDETRLEIAIRLPEDAAGRLQPGDDATVTRVRDGREAATTVARIGSADHGDPARADLALAADTVASWMPGEAVQVRLRIGSGNGLQVPLAAVVRRGDAATRVFRIEEGRVVPVPVEVGRFVGESVQVRGELNPGDAVVIAGQSRLVGGERVRVLR